MTDTELDALVDDAFVVAFPLYEFARTRHVDAVGALGEPPLAPNALRHQRALSSADDRWITTPNHDTLYSRAWLDLSRGPVTLTVDAQPPGRYWSVALMDATTRNVAMLGMRLHGAGPARITLVGPGAAAGAPPDGERVRLPGRDLWLLARWIVEGPQDLDAARAMQARLTVIAPSGATPASVVPTASTDPANLLAVANEQLARNPPVGPDAERVARLAGVGLVPGRVDAFERLPEPVRRCWTARIAAIHARLRGAIVTLRRQVDGWWVVDDALRVGDHEVAWRAAVALGGLGALDADEAVYAGRVADDTGAPLHGRHAYRVHVPPEGLPARAFWSLSMYALMPDGRKFFVHNPIGRHAIGDRTPGLRREADGSLRLWLQAREPADPVARANWLPAPDGPFNLTLRAYWPSEALRRWAVPLPRLERLPD